MRKRFSICIVLSGILLSSILSVLVNASNVFAASAIDNKYLAKDLLNCYSQRLKREIVPDQVYETEDLLLDEWTTYNFWGDPLDEREPLAALHTTEDGNDEMGCIELLDKLGFTANNANVGDVLLRLGYEPQTANGKCITMNFQTYDADNDIYVDYASKAKLCAGSVDSNGVIQGELMGYSAVPPDDVYGQVFTGFSVYDGVVHLYEGMDRPLAYDEYGDEGVPYEIGVTKWDDLVRQIDTSTAATVESMGHFAYSYPFYYNGYNSVAGDAGAVSSYKLTDPVTAFMNVGYKSAFGSDYDYDTKLKVSSKEQAVLYQNYLSQYYAVKSDACADTKDASTQAASNLGSTWVQTKVYGADGKPKYCYVTATKHQYDGVYGITGNTTSIVSDGRIYWEDIAAWLLDNGPNSIDAGAVSGDIIDGSGTYTTPTGGSGNSSGDDETQTNKLEEACYEHAKSLGWVICPMIFGLREVTESIYEWIEPLIRVSDTTVSQLGNQNSNLFKAWNTFRGIANIIFVILFMFIIFSQLTGWGIDNYGIKRMLPKLIITAILVNLSFIICAIAVDASNVIGKGIEGLFEQLGGTIMMKDVSGAEAGNIVSGAVAVSDSVSAQKHIIGEVVSWLVIAAGGIGVGFLIQGWAIIIPILFFLLTVFISIIFAMIILGLRQAIVIILIVLAPVAFACSVLPNTEPVFKKWVSAFKGILVVYPVVGALIGAGYFTSSLIYTGEESGTGLTMTIVAGLLSVVPYFLIPSLTRKSLDGIGMIGSKIGGMGKNAGIRAKGAINRSDLVSNAKADSKAGARRRAAGLYMKTFGKGVKKDMDAGKKISMSRANRYARNASLAVSDRESVVSARAAQSKFNRLNSASGFGAAMSAADMAEDATTTKNYETMLAAGDYKYTDASGKTVSVDSQSNQAIADALQHELSQRGEKYDANKVRALTNALAAKGKEGRDLMYHAVSGAQGAGASRQAIKDFSSNIMNNHAGTMKEKARSLYEFAKNTADLDPNALGNAASIESFAGSGVGSLTAADMTNMDIQQLKRYRESVSGNDVKTLAGLAQSALTDEHLSKDLSEKTRSELETIAKQGGYTPPTNGLSGDSGKIHTATSTQVSTAQADAQQIAATQTAKQLQDAVRNSASVPTDVIVNDNGKPISSNANTTSSAPKSVILGPDGKPLGKA